MIQWNRIARPQIDLYDMQIILEEAQKKHISYFDVFVPEHGNEDYMALFDGTVKIQVAKEKSPYEELENGRVYHKGIHIGISLLGQWPELYQQFPHIVRYIHPLRIPSEKTYTLSSCSGSHEHEFGLVYITEGHPFVVAEALVHEMAHLKLFALGLGITESKGFILNLPENLYESPVIRHMPRPMTAVFHAQYTFTHILHLDNILLEGEHSERNLSILLNLLTYTLIRIERGLEILREHVVLDEKGKAFFEGYYNWADEVVARSNALLKLHKYPKPTLNPVEYTYS